MDSLIIPKPPDQTYSQPHRHKPFLIFHFEHKSLQQLVFMMEVSL